jgi:drug/metabolite transporter (DMT)-like permease
MSRIIDIYIAGGVEYMHPVTIILLFNLGVIVYVIVCVVRKREFNKNWLEAVKHFSGFAVAFGVFGTLVGLFLAFDVLEKSAIPFQVIMGGLKVALINTLYGLIVFFISMLAYIVLKLRINLA